LSHEALSGNSAADRTGATLGNMLRKYRSEVNADLLFVSVDLSSKGGGVNDGSSSTEKGIHRLSCGYQICVCLKIAYFFFVRITCSTSE
jgi:hypothetical protein